jgi:clan AA aspartic protease (TIGR02281 family)
MLIFRRLISVLFLLFFELYQESFAVVKNPVYPVMSFKSVYQATSLFDVNQYSSIKVIPQMDNTMAVPVVINKRQSSTFLIDTGASYTVITPHLAKQLGVMKKSPDNVLPLNTANGMAYVPVVTIKQVILGDMIVQNVQAVVTDLGPSAEISGLLGMNFFTGRTLLITPQRIFISRK